MKIASEVSAGMMVCGNEANAINQTVQEVDGKPIKPTVNVQDAVTNREIRFKVSHYESMPLAVAEIFVRVFYEDRYRLNKLISKCHPEDKAVIQGLLDSAVKEKQEWSKKMTLKRKATRDKRRLESVCTPVLDIPELDSKPKFNLIQFLNALKIAKRSNNKVQ